MFKFQDIKINIKPVFPALIHSESYEGPCRVGDHADLTPEAEREKNKVMADREVWELCENVQSNVNILQPAYFERSDDFVVHENELQKLEPDIYDADLVLI